MAIKMKCPDCKGSGVYIGIFKQEACTLCKGSGTAEVYRVTSKPVNGLVEYSREELERVVLGEVLTPRPDQVAPGVYAARALRHTPGRSVTGRVHMAVKFTLVDHSTTVTHYVTGEGVPTPINGKTVYLEIGSGGGVRRVHQKYLLAQRSFQRMNAKSQRFAAEYGHPPPYAVHDETVLLEYSEANRQKVMDVLKAQFRKWEDAKHIDRVDVRRMVEDVVFTY
jgi:hypothetical protein